MAQAIRQEINLACTSTGSAGTGTVPVFALLDTTKYSGSPTYWFEACYNGAASNTGTVQLRDIAAATNVATLTGATSSTYIISRIQFTPTAGARTYQIQLVGDGTRTQTIHGGRIIVLQSETSISSTQTQIEIGSTTSNLTNTAVADITFPKFWTYTAANWDGTKAFSVEVVWTTSAANTCTITLCRTSDNAANVTIVNALSNAVTRIRTRVSFTPVNGETYKIRCLGSTTKSTYAITCAKIVVDQTGSPTKIEPQFLLLNTTDNDTTGVMNCLVEWNSSEWSAESGSITYKHLMDSDNAANSAKLRDVTASADITNGTVTGTGQQVSSALGSFTDGNNLDTWVLNTTSGAVYASRIQVIYVFVATGGAAPRRIFISKW